VSARVLAALAMGVLLGAVGCSRPQPPGAADIDANNRGVGLMGKFAFDDALAVFEKLAGEHPEWLQVKVNLAIATLNRQIAGDEGRALELLAEVLAADPNHLRAHYCSGILKYQHGRLEAAMKHFRRVIEGDAADAYAAYYVGQGIESADREGALSWYERAIERDGYLLSAYYRRFQVLLRLGRSEEALVAQRDWERLKDNPRARIVEPKYTRMGPKAEALAIDLPDARRVPPPQGPIFADPRPLPIDGAGGVTWSALDADRAPSLTVSDLDGDGDLDLFIADAIRGPKGAANAVLINTGSGRFDLALEHPLALVADVRAALWGDYDNDGHTDVYLCRRGPNQLWRQVEPGRWEDVTETTGTANGDRDTVDGAMFDADHDGDLDIFCVNADGPNELLNNNLDGTFRPIAKERGIAGDGGASRQVLVADLDHDRDADIVVINEKPPHEVYQNDRLWAYRPAPGTDRLLEATIRAAVAGDVDADGRLELLTVSREGVVEQWRRNDDGVWSSITLLPGNETDAGAPQIALLDVTGDGALNVLVSAPGGWYAAAAGKEQWGVLYRGGRSASGRLGWAPAVLDAARGPAVVGLPGHGPPLIWSPGPGRHVFAALSFSGREDAGQSMRSNASGIGVHAQVRVDSRWTVFDTFSNHSGPGRSLQPIAVGLGGAGDIDFVAIDWSDGVFQSEIDLASGRAHRITETQRQTSSCPVLFAWNGERYAFVSDLLGVGGLGYLVAPGEYAPPRPWENLMLPPGPPDALRPKDGRYVLKLTEPMEEVCYLDAARLVVYDLPPGWRMTLDERMAIAGPEPTGEPRFYRDELLPVQAVDGRGEDVTARLVEADLRAAPVGALDHRFLGRLAADQVITLTFPEPLDASAGEPILIADGWIEYPYSQTMFAAWQAGADYRAPTLEARGADGRWRPVLEQFGYPAGMPRQMSVPLGDLPAGTTQLRLSTNQEIYWDRLAVAYARPCPQVRRRVQPLRAARLGRSGFSLRTTGVQRLPHYDYDRRAPFWDTRHQRGLYTAFGPVDELLAATDDALAVFGPGEEIHLEFEAASEPLETGWTRYFVFETAGWCKDMDLFTRDGETVGPLPVAGRASAERDRLHERYLTRFQSGR